MAPIVDDPAAARPLPAAVEGLVALSRSYRTVAVVSGRPLSFLAEHLPDEVDLSGLYGLESRHNGQVSDHPNAARWRPVVAEAVERMRADAPTGAVVEPKGLSLTVHFRTAPEAQAAVADLASRVGAELGLNVSDAKMSVELHPPIDADKGSALRALAEGASAVLYAGDDRGDLPAFAALTDLRRSGLTTAGVAIGGDELPTAVAEAADLVLAQQVDVVDLLAALEPGPHS